MAEWRYSSTFHDFETKRMSVISFTIPATLPPGKLSHWLRSWVGSTAGLDAVEKVKNLLSLPGIEPRPFSPQLIANPPFAQEAFRDEKETSHRRAPKLRNRCFTRFKHQADMLRALT
jgi:hypothetical protein